MRRSIVKVNKRHFTSVISGQFGRFASKEFSPLVQHFINLTYVRLMGLDMREFEDPSYYKSLNKLFTRALRRPREYSDNPQEVISSVDARITDTGTITNGRAYQIKGMSYEIEGLFGSFHQQEVSEVEGGVFINFYLSPKDYHRYHMPMDLTILSATHIPGKLYPVNFPLLRHKHHLFIENERVILSCKDAKGNSHILVLVGALNVGKMTLSFDETIQTNMNQTQPTHHTYENLYLKKGDLLGWFEMGSTILMFSQKGAFFPEVAINQKSRFGEPIGYLL